MEPNEASMITWRTVIEFIGKTGVNAWSLKLDSFPVLFHIPTEVPDWNAGDIVKLTITKEPKPDAKPRPESP